jgi:hypothetical protein
VFAKNVNKCVDDRVEESIGRSKIVHFQITHKLFNNILNGEIKTIITIRVITHTLQEVYLLFDGAIGIYFYIGIRVVQYKIINKFL